MQYNDEMICVRQIYHLFVEFFKQGLMQDYIEKKLQPAFQFITDDLSKDWAQYEMPAITRDTQTQYPRKVSQQWVSG